MNPLYWDICSLAWLAFDAQARALSKTLGRPTLVDLAAGEGSSLDYLLALDAARGGCLEKHLARLEQLGICDTAPFEAEWQARAN